MISTFSARPAQTKIVLEVENEPIPTSPETLFNQTVYVTDVDVLNPTGSTITVTITNKAGDPWIVFPVSPNNSLMTYRSNRGKKLTGGIAWSASATGLIGDVSAGPEPR